MNCLRINVLFICSMLISHLTFAQSQSNKSTLSLSEGKEQVRDILELGDGYVVLTYALGSKEIKVRYFDDQGNNQWTKAFADKPYRFRYYHCLKYEDHLMLLTGKLGFAPNALLIDKSGVEVKKFEKYKDVAQLMGIYASGKDIGYVHVDDARKNEADTYSLTRFSKDGLTAKNSSVLKLPPLQSGKWDYHKHYNGNIFFSGVNKGYNEDNSVSVIYLACAENGELALAGTYNLLLDDKKYPVPEWQGSEGAMGPHSNIHFDPEHGAIYVYGLFQTKRKDYVTGMASVKLRHEGFYIHKLDFDGKVVWKKQEYFAKGLGVPVSYDKKVMDFTIDKLTGQINFTLLIDTKYGASAWAHKPFVFIYDSKDGSLIAQQKRTIIDQFNEVTITIFSFEPENWVQARSTGYKGISKFNEEDPHWVRSMSKLLKGKPVATLAKNNFYAVFSKSDHTVIFEYDKKDKKTSSLNVYRFE